jgi:PST family polysaccharide transporter
MAGSYKEIVKSSALIGGTSVINVALGILRTKVLALLIGPAGMGLFSAFSSVTTLVSSVAGMGINTSGVRQIAEATGSNDAETIARTVTVLRRTSLLLGVFGAVLFLVLARPLATVTFGDASYVGALALLSITILFTQVAAAQTALVQGMRRIRDLAAISLWGGVLGTVISIPVVFLFREKGIVPFLLIISALTIGTSWWYSRKVCIPSTSVPSPIFWAEVKKLLGMGVVFMASGLLTSLVAYLTRVLVIREINIEAAGLYQSAYTLSGVYVGFILSAMGADYYPRLTAVAGDNEKVNRLVNEQTEAALLMAVPGIIGTLTFAPLVIQLLYSAKFVPAVDILRWQLLGIFGRIVTWPIGFVLLAKGKASLYFWSELAINVIQLILVWFGVKWFGLSGLGIAFFMMYVVYAPLILYIVHRESGFRWSPSNIRLGSCALCATLAVFLAAFLNLPAYSTMTIGAIATALSALFSVRRLAFRLGLTPASAFNRFRLKFSTT